MPLPANYPITLTSAIALTKELAGIEAADTSQNDRLALALEASAGIYEGGTCYRPYYCAAQAIATDIPRQTFAEADDGVKWITSDGGSNLPSVIRHLLLMQQAIDAKYGVIVPEGFAAEELLDALCGCKAAGKPNATRPYRLGALVP